MNSDSLFRNVEQCGSSTPAHTSLEEVVLASTEEHVGRSEELDRAADGSGGLGDDFTEDPADIFVEGEDLEGSQRHVCPTLLAVIAINGAVTWFSSQRSRNRV